MDNWYRCPYCGKKLFKILNIPIKIEIRCPDTKCKRIVEVNK
jgi:phage FluMu protein Com